LNRESFLPHLNSEFKIGSSTPAIPVKLVEITETKKFGDKRQSFSGFSLIFSGPTGKTINSGMLQLDHHEIGGLQLFISPIGKHDGQVKYQAVFSQRA
jgi:hypothetical protein